MRKTNHIEHLKRAAVLLLCAVMMLLTACGSDEPEPVELQEGASFSVGVTSKPDGLNPFFATSELTKEFFLLTYDPLWRLNAAGEPVNCLLEDWSLSSDQLTWTLRIRKDVVFSDGWPLTAEDVRFTYEQMARSSTAYADAFAGISSLTCPDEYTLIITTSYVKGDMQYNQIPILPKHIWEPLVESGLRDFENTEMIGTGPFAPVTVEKAPQEVSWNFQAKKEYMDGPAKIGTVNFVYFVTETNAARALANGEIDAAVGLTDVQVDMLEVVPGVQLFQAILPTSEVWALAFNTRKGVFQDPNMRQMVEYAVDRSQIVSLATGDMGMDGSVWASPGVDYFSQLGNLRTMNWDAARSIVYAAGYNDIDSDGNLELIASKDDLKLTLYTSSTQDSWTSTASTILVDDLSRLGIQVNWRTTDGPVEEKCTGKTEWDMCMVSWRGDYNAVLAALPFASGASGLTGWHSDQFSQVYAQMQTAVDRENLRALAGQLQQIFYNECPYIILGYPSDIQAIRGDRWTGYDDVLAASGGLIHISSADFYMNVTPAESVG